MFCEGGFRLKPDILNSNLITLISVFVVCQWHMHTKRLNRMLK